MTDLKMREMAAGILPKISHLIPLQLIQSPPGASLLIPMMSGNIVMVFHTVIVSSWIETALDLNKYFKCSSQQICGTRMFSSTIVTTGCEGYLVLNVNETDITASTELDDGTLTYPSYQGRLDSIPAVGVGGSWCADAGDANPWVEVSVSFFFYEYWLHYFQNKQRWFTDMILWMSFA